MKRVACFFCDIMGTLDGQESNQALDYQELNDLLLSLKNALGVDFILFSLISSENASIVQEKKEVLSVYFDPSIVFGRQFFEEGYIKDQSIVMQGKLGKPMQIANYMLDLKEFSIERIYYADDCKFLHELLFVFAESEDWKDKLYSLVPEGNRGLVELNDLLRVKLEEFQWLQLRRIIPMQTNHSVKMD